MNNFSLSILASAFAAGLLSFFSPCIFPLLPVYLGYFSTDETNEKWSLSQRIMVKLLKTLLFVAGLSLVFFLLGFGAGALGEIFSSASFSIACGIVVLIFGLYHAELIHIPILSREKRLPLQFVDNNYISVFLLGVVFSFGWTPCIGPILASILSLTAQNGNAITGGGLLLVYSLGLSIPFLVLSVGTSVLLSKIQKINRYLPQIKLVGGLLIFAMGLWMIFSQVQTLEQAAYNHSNSEIISEEEIDTGEEFALTSITGETIRLSDYRGKPVCIKFWGTWCPSCMIGLENFSKLSRELNNEGDVKVLSIVAPDYHGEMGTEDFINWSQGQELDFPILLDEGAQVNRHFQIKAYPTYLFFDAQGNLSETRVGDIQETELESILKDLKS